MCWIRIRNKPAIKQDSSLFGKIKVYFKRILMKFNSSEKVKYFFKVPPIVMFKNVSKNNLN